MTRKEKIWAAAVFELGARTVEAWLETRKDAQRRRRTPASRTEAGIRKELRDAYAVAHVEMTKRHAEMNGRLEACTLEQLVQVHEPKRMSAFMVNCLPKKYSGYEGRLLTALATVVRKKVKMKKKSQRREMALV